MSTSTTTSPAVTAVFVTYNSSRKIGEALEAARQSYDAGLLDCIVVDNQSADGTAELVEREHPWARVIRSPGNIGYGRGLNLGMAHTKTPYALLMNPDAVLPADAVNTLVEFMEGNPRAALAAPTIIEGEGTLQPAGRLPTPWRMVAKAAGFASPPQRPILPGEAPFETDWLCGAILMARMDVMRAIGGFDPRFFLYFEETDLCRRVSRHGFELWAVGQAVAHHSGSDSAKGTHQKLYKSCIAEHYFQSRFYFMVKFFGWPIAATAELLEYSLLSLKTLVRKCTGRRPDQAVLDRLGEPLLRMPKRVENQELIGLKMQQAVEIK